MTERMIYTGGVELCTESFGDPTDPPILLIMGIGASMLWWEEGFCRLLVAGRRFVRDPLRPSRYRPLGHLRPRKPAVHRRRARQRRCGCSRRIWHPLGSHRWRLSGGAFAQLLAMDYPDRVLSPVLISSSPATPGDRKLPSPIEEFGRFVSTAQVDWSDADSVIEYLVGYMRMLAGSCRPFEETTARDLVRRDLERARDFPAVQNHNSIPGDDRKRKPLSSISTPTLVIHGSADPMFPIEHGESLVAEISEARLLRPTGAGHGVARADWQRIVRAILQHGQKIALGDEPA